MIRALSCAPLYRVQDIEMALHHQVDNLKKSALSITVISTGGTYLHSNQVSDVGYA